MTPIRSRYRRVDTDAAFTAAVLAAEDEYSNLCPAKNNMIIQGDRMSVLQHRTPDWTPNIRPSGTWGQRHSPASSLSGQSTDANPVWPVAVGVILAMFVAATITVSILNLPDSATVPPASSTASGDQSVADATYQYHLYMVGLITVVFGLFFTAGCVLVLRAHRANWLQQFPTGLRSEHAPIGDSIRPPTPDPILHAIGLNDQALAEWATRFIGEDKAQRDASIRAAILCCDRGVATLSPLQSGPQQAQPAAHGRPDAAHQYVEACLLNNRAYLGASLHSPETLTYARVDRAAWSEGAPATSADSCTACARKALELINRNPFASAEERLKAWDTDIFVRYQAGGRSVDGALAADLRAMLARAEALAAANHPDLSNWIRERRAVYATLLGESRAPADH